jgi:hypothetical protein
MALKAGPPGKGSRAQLTLVLVGRVTVIRYQVLVQPVSHNKYIIYIVSNLNMQYNIKCSVRKYVDKAWLLAPVGTVHS